MVCARHKISAQDDTIRAIQLSKREALGMNRFDITMKKIEAAHKAHYPTTAWQPLNTHDWTNFQTLATQVKNSYNK